MPRRQPVLSRPCLTSSTTRAAQVYALARGARDDSHALLAWRGWTSASACCSAWPAYAHSWACSGSSTCSGGCRPTSGRASTGACRAPSTSRHPRVHPAAAEPRRRRPHSAHDRCSAGCSSSLGLVTGLSLVLGVLTRLGAVLGPPAGDRDHAARRQRARRVAVRLPHARPALGPAAAPAGLAPMSLDDALGRDP